MVVIQFAMSLNATTITPNSTLDSGALLLSAGIFEKAAAATTGKKSDAKGVGTRFEMREVTFWACLSDLSKNEKKIKPWRIEGAPNRTNNKSRPDKLVYLSDH